MKASMHRVAIVGFKDTSIGSILPAIEAQFNVAMFVTNDSLEISSDVRASLTRDRIAVPIGGILHGRKVISGDEFKATYSSLQIDGVLLLDDSPSFRESMFNACQDFGLEIYGFIHPTSYIAESARVNSTAVIGAFCYVGHSVEVSRGVLIYQNSAIEHHSTIAEYVTISPQFRGAGRLRIEAGTTICFSVETANNISISSNCIIGAGSLVLHDCLISESTYYGRPARFIRKI